MHLFCTEGAAAGENLSCTERAAAGENIQNLLTDHSKELHLPNWTLCWVYMDTGKQSIALSGDTI